MATYKDIDDFIIEAFPLECEKISRQKKSDVEVFIEKANANFEENLKAIIEAAETTASPEPEIPE